MGLLTFNRFIGHSKSEIQGGFLGFRGFYRELMEGLIEIYVGKAYISNKKEELDFESNEVGIDSHQNDYLPVSSACFHERFQCKVADKIRNSEGCQDETTFGVDLKDIYTGVSNDDINTSERGCRQTFGLQNVEATFHL
ncbi:hypothetical protein M9H77_12969 [Catharanthus roseus]|uniref:Uncharacterized protein n=1 Tax=Catharanthus roseus TaxID=4058 RepID=A0ACC0BIT6_CATRO|nr:hypothetical protein M9H77_12969 [Catharanthus roseus]